jgi:phospholipase C
MGKFVKDYARAYPKATPAQWSEVMAYHDVGSLPALHALGEAFAVCDHWFSSVPGPTWANRLFAMSGTSQGRVEMPSGIFHPNLHRYDQPSVFRRVEKAGRSCRVYFGDFPLSLLLEDRRSAAGARALRLFSRFAADAAGPEADFPDLAWIEPDYLGSDANDDHPPHDVMAGQALVADVYETIRANPALFESTLLVVTYDEHGGFYDHVPPPPALPPDSHDEEYDFTRCGVRVPMLCISPWLHAQVVSTAMDHTALLRSLQLRWKLGALGKRVAAAPDLFSLLRLAPAPRTDLPSLVAPKPKALPRAARALAKAAAEERLSGNEQAIVAFGAWLDAQTPAPAAAKARALRKAALGPRDSRQVAQERALSFLRSRRAKP